MSRKLTWIGIVITAAYLIAAALLSWGRWDQFSAMKPNEVGDFLAGVVGPLALLWLILGYFQQGEELRNSAEALRVQAEELRASVEQQRDLVSVSRQQFDAELQQRDIEKQQRKQAMQPRFALTPGERRAEGGREFHRLVLKNAGGPAFSVSGFIQHGAEDLQSFMWSYIGPHEERFLEVDVPMFGQAYFMITVRFSDAERDAHAALFSVEVRRPTEASISTRVLISELAVSLAQQNSHEDEVCTEDICEQDDD